MSKQYPGRPPSDRPNFYGPGVPMERDTQRRYPFEEGRALYEQYNPLRIDIHPGDAIGCLLGALGNMEKEELASRFVELAQRTRGEYVGMEHPSGVAQQMLNEGYLTSFEIREIVTRAGRRVVHKVIVVAPTKKLLETIVGAQKKREER